MKAARGKSAPIEFDRIRRAIEAWQRCPEYASWPQELSSIALVDWMGDELAWPGGAGEAFSIFRVSDSSVVGDETLDCAEALALNWRITQFHPAVLLPAVSVQS
jgi:hypothetical protein